MKRALPFLFLVGLPTPATAEQPNIVLILADDLGYADVGAYGNKTNQTPHLDRMVREGVRFTDSTPMEPIVLQHEPRS